MADNASNRIYRIDTNGYSSLFSEGVSYPKGLAAASNGTFYVANAANNSVIRVAPDGSVATIARGLNDPSGVALDEARGHLYVSNAGSGTIIRIVLADGSFSTVVRNLVLPSGLAYLKNRLYVYLPDSRDGETVYKNLSELWAFDVMDPAFARTRVIRTPLRVSRGLAMHPSGTGPLYIAQPEENYLVKIDPATGVMSRFVTTAPSPEDVALDALGRIYLACRGTDASDQVIQVFGADGVLLGTITDKIDRPISLAYDPDTQDVFVGNGATGAAGSGSIQRIKTADWTVSDVLGGLTNPTGIAFSGADMWLISGGNAYRVDSYKTAAVLVTPKAVARNNLLDLELAPDGTLFTLDSGSLWRYPRDDQGKYAAEYRQSYNFVGGGARMAPIGTTGVYFSSPGAGVYTHTFGGSTPAKWAGLFNLFGGTISGFVTTAIAAGTYQGQDYLYVTSSQYNGYSGLTRINLTSAVSEARHVFDSSESRGPHGVGFDPATGKAWSIGASTARVLRFDTGFTKIEKSLLETDSSNIGYGGACWNGDFYATIHTQHRLEKYSGVNTITRTLVPTGLGGPEI
ncbi:Serine/threonine-protein kinase PknD [compost metagenome]